MKRNLCGSAAVAVAALLLASCGGDSSPANQPPPTSQLAKRAYVSNEFGGIIQIVDAATDTLDSQTITSGGNGPQTMVVAGDKKTSLVFNAGNNVLLRIDNATEAGISATTLPGYTDSMAASADGTKVYAALRNAPSSTGTPLGVVSVVDYTAGTNTPVDVPLARRLVLGPNGAKLLVFSDNSDSVTVIDTATKAKTVIALPVGSRPAWGVFSTDSNTAFIMNCGPECGGTTAGVAQLDMTSNTITTTVPVSAATIGLLDGSNLYVAGTVTAGTGGGRLDVLNTSGLTVTTSGVTSGVVINDGYHTTMAISNGHVFVGARACSNVAEGCLSIYSSGSVVIGTPKGEITGMMAISGRAIVYVIEGGELRIYDSSTDSEKLPAPVNITGKAWDVKSVD